MQKYLITLALLLASLVHLTAANIRPDAPEGARAVIQDAIDRLPPEGGTVLIPAGRYILDGMLHIDRSHVALRGEPGTVLVLADDVKQPNLLIGSDAKAPREADMIGNIYIGNIELDGNKAAQDSEFHPTMPWLRNNTIDVRAVDDLIIENVNAHNARSGGIVASWECERITIHNSQFHHNFFDGIALYASRHIIVSDFLCYANNAAGLSLDNRLRDITFANGHIYNNQNVGIFARDCDGLYFRNLVIRDNGSFGTFLAHTVYPKGHPKEGKIVPHTGINNSHFSNCSFIDNGGNGIWFVSTPELSKNNSIMGCTFSGNIGPSIRSRTEDMLHVANNLNLNEKVAAGTPKK